MSASSAPCAPWLAVALVVYIAAACAISFRGFLHRSHVPPGAFRDQLAQWARTTLAALEPFLMRAGLQPTLLTCAQLGMSVLAGAAYAGGVVFLGGWLVLACGVLDLLDGSLARRTSQATPRGAFLDSVIDRYAEFFTLCGLGVLFADSWMLWVVACGLLGSMMVSYTRARAEGLGIECRGGLMQRAERYVLLGVGSFLNSVYDHLLCQPTHVLLSGALILFAVLTNLTALSRVRAVLLAVEGKRLRPIPPSPTEGDTSTLMPLSSEAPPGQEQRLVGSMFLPLGVGCVLETSYQPTGIVIIVSALALVLWGWAEAGVQKLRHRGQNAQVGEQKAQLP
ncbi:MAG: CDP-alcohol phosphatidyltransferase family protein [Candidatus Binatia bacterium]|nr:CDP-alcohol phosphatidyltransferase family protein [Candidatus Binatia bacterium]